jgi:hypothetical protein
LRNVLFCLALLRGTVTVAGVCRTTGGQHVIDQIQMEYYIDGEQVCFRRDNHPAFNYSIHISANPDGGVVGFPFLTHSLCWRCVVNNRFVCRQVPSVAFQPSMMCGLAFPSRINQTYTYNVSTIEDPRPCPNFRKFEGCVPLN